ncbi:MAG TPA: hypothetical protein VIX89_14775 [Bryobacteraceae bacterium]
MPEKYVIAALGPIQAVILTFPVFYLLTPRSFILFGALFVFFIVGVAVFVFLVTRYRDTMAVRLKGTAVTLVISVGTAYGIFEHAHCAWWGIGLSAAVFFVGMAWTFEGTRESAG